MIEDGVLAFRLVNTAKDGRYRIHFEALAGGLSDYAVHVIIAPHLVNAGANNTGWTGDF